MAPFVSPLSHPLHSQYHDTRRQREAWEWLSVFWWNTAFHEPQCLGYYTAPYPTSAVASVIGIDCGKYTGYYPMFSLFHSAIAQCVVSELPCSGLRTFYVWKHFVLDLFTLKCKLELFIHFSCLLVNQVGKIWLFFNVIISSGVQSFLLHSTKGCYYSMFISLNTSGFQLELWNALTRRFQPHDIQLPVLDISVQALVGTLSLLQES